MERVIMNTTFILPLNMWRVRERSKLLLSLLCQLLCFSPTPYDRVPQNSVLVPFFCLLIPLVISHISIALNTICMLTTPEFISSSALSRLVYPATLAYPIQCPIGIANIQHNTFKTRLLLSSLPQLFCILISVLKLHWL